MAYDPLNDREFDSIKARIDAAGDDDTAEQLAADIGARRDAAEHPIRRFALNAPKNIGVGAWKALVNTVDTLSDIGTATNPAAIATEAVGGEDLRKEVYPSLSEQYPEFMDSMRNFTSAWERNDTMSDDIAQGVAQFAIPFMGWMKLAGGMGKAGAALKVGKALAVEGATAASAFDPHDGRVADLLEMGRESETRFGTLLRQVAPDESLMNQYIDYMTDRDNEGVAEGRWKNAVDAVVSSAAVGGLLKGAATTHKATKALVGGALDDLTTPSGFGPGKQRGMVNFHGSPHDFDSFRMDKLGTGEGAQAYGYGLYFAEAPGVAKAYRTAGGPYLEHNGERVFAEEWDGLPGAKGAVKDLIMEGNRYGLKDDGIKMFVEREIKRNPERWGLKNRKEVLEALDLAKNTRMIRGKFYEVDIDDAAIAKMLDYDAPLSEQPHILAKIPAKDKAALEDMLEEQTMYSPDLTAFSGKELQAMIGRAIEEDRIAFNPIDGVWDGNPDKYAAQYFKEHDIPGLRFLDQQSRNHKFLSKAPNKIDQALKNVVDWNARLKENDKVHQTLDDMYRKYGSQQAIDWLEQSGPDASIQEAKDRLLQDIKARPDATRNTVLFDDSLVKILKKE